MVIFSSYIAFEVDYGNKRLIFNGIKAPAMILAINLPEYHIEFGNPSEQLFASTISSGVMNIICQSFSAECAGFDVNQFTVSAHESFSFGGSRKSKKTTTVIVEAELTASQEHDWYISNGCYVKATGDLSIASPDINFDFGDITCNQFITVPPTFFEKLFTPGRWCDSSHKEFGIESVKVRSAHINVQSNWWLLAKQCEIRANAPTLKFWADKGYMSYSLATQVVDSRHPIVSHAECYYAYGSLTVSEKNDLGCHGHATRNVITDSHGKKGLARYPFATLIEMDPHLETYYPSPSFLSSYSETGEKDPQYQQMVIDKGVSTYSYIDGTPPPVESDDYYSGSGESKPFWLSNGLANILNIDSSTPQWFRESTTRMDWALQQHSQMLARTERSERIRRVTPQRLGEHRVRSHLGSTIPITHSSGFVEDFTEQKGAPATDIAELSTMDFAARQVSDQRERQQNTAYGQSAAGVFQALVDKTYDRTQEARQVALERFHIVKESDLPEETLRTLTTDSSLPRYCFDKYAEWHVTNMQSDLLKASNALSAQAQVTQDESIKAIKQEFGSFIGGFVEAVHMDPEFQLVCIPETRGGMLVFGLGLKTKGKKKASIKSAQSRSVKKSTPDKKVHVGSHQPKKVFRLIRGFSKGEIYATKKQCSRWRKTQTKMGRQKQGL